MAPPYQFSTTVIALLLPPVLVLAYQRRSRVWAFLSVVAVALMLASLLRKPVASGVLLALTIPTAWRGRGLWLFMLSLFGSATSDTAAPFLKQVAAGAPYIQDHLAGLYTLSYLAVVAVPVLARVFAPPAAPVWTLVPARRTP